MFPVPSAPTPRSADSHVILVHVPTTYTSLPHPRAQESEGKSERACQSEWRRTPLRGGYAFANRSPPSLEPTQHFRNLARGLTPASPNAGPDTRLLESATTNLFPRRTPAARVENAYELYSPLYSRRPEKRSWDVTPNWHVIFFLTSPLPERSSAALVYRDIQR